MKVRSRVRHTHAIGGRGIQTLHHDGGQVRSGVAGAEEQGETARQRRVRHVSFVAAAGLTNAG